MKMPSVAEELAKNPFAARRSQVFRQLKADSFLQFNDRFHLQSEAATRVNEPLKRRVHKSSFPVYTKQKCT